MRTTRIAFTLLFVAAAAHAQLKESITVSYVEVPVTVLDRSGNPIRGLTQANFEVTDEGKKRDINGFETIDFGSHQTAAAAPVMTPAARRNFLLLFDLSFSSPASIKRAQDAARNFATKMAGRDDRIAVASVDAAHGFRLLTSFTTDHALVDAAIGNPTGFRAADPLQLAGSGFDPDVAQAMIVDKPGGAKGQGINNIVEDTIGGLNSQQDAYNRQKIDRQVTLLGGLATTLRSVRGVKHIVLLSEGFDPRLVQGRDAGTSEDKQKEQTALEHGEIWNVNTDDRYGSSTSMSLVNRLADISKRSDVVLDAIDIMGVRGQTDARTGFSK
ncbi:MAG TPA: VWA domain-containing protein, partial [Thermoanaerobaculia bacterium]